MDVRNVFAGHHILSVGEDALKDIKIQISPKLVGSGE